MAVQVYRRSLYGMAQAFSRRVRLGGMGHQQEGHKFFTTLATHHVRAAAVLGQHSGYMF